MSVGRGGAFREQTEISFHQVFYIAAVYRRFQDITGMYATGSRVIELGPAHLFYFYFYNYRVYFISS